MATVSVEQDRTAFAVASGQRRAPRSIGRFIDRWALPAFTTLALVYLLIPIAVMILFSFNDYQGKFNFVWHGFTLNGWLRPDRVARPAAVDPEQPDHRVRGDRRIDHPRNADRPLPEPLPVPRPRVDQRPDLPADGDARDRDGLQPPDPLREQRAATAQRDHPEGTLFPLGMTTILIAHVMFNISYVVVTVKARLAGFDRHLEEAAMDLGANEWTTFRKVTFPLILPGVLAAALLAFSLSIDDYVITSFVSGTTNTFPIWVWGIIKNALPVQINVVGSIVFLVAVGGVALTTVLQGRQARSFR